jgi:type II secretory pathway pseudopilin PulG
MRFSMSITAALIFYFAMTWGTTAVAERAIALAQGITHAQITAAQATRHQLPMLSQDCQRLARDRSVSLASQAACLQNVHLQTR